MRKTQSWEGTWVQRRGFAKKEAVKDGRVGWEEGTSSTGTEERGGGGRRMAWGPGGLGAGVWREGAAQFQKGQEVEGRKGSLLRKGI